MESTNARQLLEVLAKRLTWVRWMNLALHLLGPILIGLAIGIAIRDYSLPKPLAFSLAGIAILVLLYFLERGQSLVRRAEAADAAALIDAAIRGKERFLTLANAAAAELEIQKAIEAQANELARGYEIGPEASFRIEKSTIFPLSLLPVAIAVLALLFWFSPAALQKDASASLELGAEKAAQIREMLEQPETLPAPLQAQLEKLANTLDERGLYSEDAREQLESALQQAEQLESLPDETTSIDNPSVEQAKKSPNDATPQSDTQNSSQESAQSTSSSSTEKSDQQKQDPLEEKLKDNDPKSDAMSQESKTPPEDKSPQAEDQSEQGSDSKSSPSEKSQNQQKTEKQAEKAKNAGKNESAGSGQGKNEGKEGASKQESPGAGQEGKAAQAGKQDGSSKQPQDDPKKDVTGLGDGKGQGQPGSKKELKSQSQSGQDDKAAEAGDAKNDSQGDGAGEGEAKDDGKADLKAGDKQGKQGQPSGKGQNSKSSEQSGEGMSDVKSKLEQIKKEMNKTEDAGGQPDASEQGAKSDEQSGNEKSEKQDASGKQGESGNSQEKSQSAKGESGQDKSQKAENPGESKGKEEANSDKAGESPSSAGEPSEQSQQGKSEQGKQSGKRPGEGDSKEANEKPDTPQSKSGQAGPGKSERPAGPNDQGKDQRDSGSTPDTPDANSKSHRPNARPEASDNATRLGPFGGGDEGMLSGKEQKQETVVIPLEEKILVREVGSTDGKRYRNPNEAKSQTELGTDEFDKPKNDVAESSQPIPVEYSDVLR